MACNCGHDKLNHETARDEGWHQGECTKCNCPCFYALRTLKKDIKAGMVIPGWHQETVDVGS